jgi:hypothetical protein
MNQPLMKALSLLLCVLASAAAAQAVDFTTLDGKVLLGYEGWFNCPGNGDTNHGWRGRSPACFTEKPNRPGRRLP